MQRYKKCLRLHFPNKSSIKTGKSVPQTSKNKLNGPKYVRWAVYLSMARPHYFILTINLFSVSRWLFLALIQALMYRPGIHVLSKLKNNSSSSTIVPRTSDPIVKNSSVSVHFAFGLKSIISTSQDYYSVKDV